MRLLVLSVFDLKVEAFGSPFFSKTRGEAIRIFGDACRDDKLGFKSHLEDYQLFLIGEFDDVSGSLSGGKPVLLIKAVDF